MKPKLWQSWNLAAGLLLLLIVALVACTVGAAGNPLTGRIWYPVNEDGSGETYRDAMPYLTFDGNGDYRGRLGPDGCGNYYTGSYTVSGQQITVNSVGMTLMGCLTGAYQYGTDMPPYLHNLQAAHSYEVSGDTLIIYYGESGALRYLAGDLPLPPRGLIRISGPAKIGPISQNGPIYFTWAATMR